MATFDELYRRGASDQPLHDGAVANTTPGGGSFDPGTFDYQALYNQSGRQGMLGGGSGAWNGGAGSYGSYNPQIFDLTQKLKAFGYGSPYYQQLMDATGGTEEGMNRAINYFNAGGGVGWQPSSPIDYGYKMGANGQWEAPAAGGAASGGSLVYDPASAGGGSNTPPSDLPPGGDYGPASWPTFGANDQYKFSPSGQYIDPGYRFRTDEGMRALMSQKAATGMLGSGQTFRDLINYGQNAASSEFGNAFNRFTTDRDFNYGVNRGDRDFAYRAATGDLDRNWSQNMDLARLGLGGAGGAGSLASTLAALLSGNLNTLGQIEGTGTMGGNNAITSAISQIIQQLLSQGTLNRFYPQGA